MVGRGGGPGLDRVHDVEDVAYNPQVARRALAYVAPHKRPVLIALVLTLISAAGNLATPYLVKVAIDASTRAVDNRSSSQKATDWCAVRSDKPAPGRSSATRWRERRMWTSPAPGGAGARRAFEVGESLELGSAILA